MRYAGLQQPLSGCHHQTHEADGGRYEVSNSTSRIDVFWLPRRSAIEVLNRRFGISAGNAEHCGQEQLKFRSVAAKLLSR